MSKVTHIIFDMFNTLYRFDPERETTQINAAKQIGKEEQPPIPRTSDGLSNKRINKDLIIEKEIMKNEQKSLKIFFLIRGDEDIFTRFKLL